MTVGVAVNWAVGDGVVAGGAPAGGGGNGTCFLQPAIATNTASNETGKRIRFRIFNVLLPFRNLDFAPGNSAFFESSAHDLKHCSCGNLYPTEPTPNTCLHLSQWFHSNPALLPQQYRVASPQTLPDSQRSRHYHHQQCDAEGRETQLRKMIVHQSKRKFKIVQQTVMARTICSNVQLLLPAPIRH